MNNSQILSKDYGKKPIDNKSVIQASKFLKDNLIKLTGSLNTKTILATRKKN